MAGVDFKYGNLIDNEQKSLALSQDHMNQVSWLSCKCFDLTAPKCDYVGLVVQVIDS
jgi:hypothetical protein